MLELLKTVKPMTTRTATSSEATARWRGRAAVLLAAALALIIPSACTSPAGPSDLVIAPGNYPAAFDAARNALRNDGFELERVDAVAGVITTRPKGGAGIATPWDSTQSTARQEWDDLMSRHARAVRITFEPTGQPAAPVEEGTQGTGSPGFIDLRAAQGEVTMRVWAVVERTYRPNRRVESKAIRLSSYTTDPALRARAMQPSYAVAWERDPRLEATIASRVNRLMPQHEPE